MLRHLVYQPVTNRRGLSLIELFLALALASLMALVMAGLFKAEMKSYLYSTGQTAVLRNVRQALDSGSSKPGMATRARMALASKGLSATQLILGLSGNTTSQYTLSGQTLLLTQSTQTFTLAKNLTSLQLAYYNINASGLIMVSTQAASAALVTIGIQSQTTTGGKIYTFYSAGRLRNRS